MSRITFFIFLTTVFVASFHNKAMALDLFGPSEQQTIEILSATGSPFSRHLAKDYQDLSFQHTGKAKRVFTSKSLQALKGETPPPEDPYQWRIQSDKESANEIFAAYKKLNAFLIRASTIEPILASNAQTNYDCWLTSYKSKNKLAIEKCKERFTQSIEQAIESIQKLPLPPTLTVKPIAQITIDESPLEEPEKEIGFFSVYFDLNKSDLNDFAYSTLEIVLEEIRNNPQVIISLLGYTDRSGSSLYNQKLARKRAKTVENHFIKSGIDPSRLTLEALGENNIAVKTDDGIKKAENRRVEIILRTP